MHRKIRISDICAALNVTYVGEDCEIDGLNLCNRKSLHKQILSYMTSDKFVDVVSQNECVIALVVDEDAYGCCLEKLKNRLITYIIDSDPEKLFYDIHDYLYYQTDFYEKCDFEPVIGEHCNIAATAVIEKGVKIGNDVTIGHHTVVLKGTVIGNSCTIGCNNTIGSEGFQILRIACKNRKIVHVGGLRIEDNVNIGDNNTICNALFEGYTYIGKEAQIDNLCYVGHNGHVGDGAVITAGSILCGSSVIEDGAWIGVNSSVLNRVVVGCNAKIGMGSVVTRDVPDNQLAYGVPARCKNNL